MIKVVGSYISPYVRKVLVCLDLKGIEYEVDPIIPFFGNDQFSAISPVRRIPVLIDGELALPDSTIICEYLEEKYPNPSLYPRSPELRAKARWLEEYSDSRIGEVFIWQYFNQLVIRPYVWGEETDHAALDITVSRDIPDVLDFIEEQLSETGFILDELSIADIAVASFFRNIFLARFKLNNKRWPKTARYTDEMLSLPSFKKLNRYEELSASTPILSHRDALIEAGAPISATSYFDSKPRKGILST